MLIWQIVCISGTVFGIVGFLTGYDLGKKRGHFVANQKIQNQLQQEQWQSTINAMFGGE